MENISPEDDKTRIGGSIQSPSADNESRQDLPSSAPSPPTFPQHDDDNASPWLTPPPEPSQPSLHPQDRAISPLDEDNMWFVVEDPGGTFEYPLRDGETITVGRDASQDIVITDKTISRKHLILQRKGDRISIQVLGLNGLVYANQIYKSTALEVTAPCSLTLGKISCRMRKKIDTDATILMSDPAMVAQQTPCAMEPPTGKAAEHPFPPSSLLSSASWRTSDDDNPFKKSPEERQPLFPGDNPTLPGLQARQSEDGSHGKPPSQPPYDFSPHPFPGSGGVGVRSVSEKNSGTGNRFTRKILLFGSLGLVGLIVAVALFFLLYNSFSGESGKQVEMTTEDEKSAAVPPPTTENPPQGETDSLYGKYIDRAKRYIDEGRTTDACGYLKDIPLTSTYRSEAVDLAKRIPGCTI